MGGMGWASPSSRTATAVVFWVFLTLFKPSVALNASTLAFDQGYSHLFGDKNLVRGSDGRTVRLTLDRYTGSGFISSDAYGFGFFSASIKLPSDYTAGVVVAFYTSNANQFEKTHDELDFEFLGNVRGRPWKVQTNVYGNGSTNRGREERYLLPFDPTLETHRYSILWTRTNIIFYVDNTPIREVRRSEAMGGDYPLKPMNVYATIWDGSTWATSGGKYKVNYKYSPFVSEFSGLILKGCRVNPIEQVTSPDRCEDLDADFAVMTSWKRRAMGKFRQKHMIYSFCYDLRRYPIPFPDCDIIPAERERFRDTGHLRFLPHRLRTRRRRRVRLPSYGGNSQAFS